MSPTTGVLDQLDLAVATAEVEELASLLRTIADEKRLKMLYLLTGGELCVCDIMDALGISQSLASHHLGVLRQAGLVRDRRDAQWVYYSINVERLAELNARYLALFDAERVSTQPKRGSPRQC